MSSSARPLLLALAAGLLSQRAHAVAGAWFETPESRVRLISRYATVPAGGDAGLGVEFQLSHGWHVYWKNAGDAGYPPALEIAGSPLEVVALRFPAPSRFDLPGGLVAFGYQDRVVYPIDARLAATEKTSVPLSAELDYLVCAESCIPYKPELELDLPVGESPLVDAATAPLVDGGRARLPAAAPAGVKGALEADGDGALTLAMTFAVAGIRAAAPELFFEPHELLALGRPRPFATAAGPGFRVPVRAIDPTRPLPARLRFAWTATGFEHAGAPVAWAGELDLARPRRAARAAFLLPFVVAFSVFPLLWIILRRGRRAGTR